MKLQIKLQLQYDTNVVKRIFCLCWIKAVFCSGILVKDWSVDFEIYVVPWNLIDQLQKHIRRIFIYLHALTSWKIWSWAIQLMISVKPNLYGQCSEICGTNHRFIPFIVQKVSANLLLTRLLIFLSLFSLWAYVSNNTPPSDNYLWS
jgi:hypothetical protein